MIIERDITIPTDDGSYVKADIFRPDNGQPAPVIMTLGPYGKGVPYEVAYEPYWKWLLAKHPNLLPGSQKQYMTWETVDPETWVPWGYICIRVDSRGAGRSPGRLDIYSPREIKDYYNAIEWAAEQPWSTGKVGLNGISYYAITQWLVASLQPPHLTCLIPWEGAADFYRDICRHGGIQSNNFIEFWYPRQVLSVQHGNTKAVQDPWMGERSTGPAALSEDELKNNRSDPIKDVQARPLDSEWYRERTPDWSKVTVPFLSAASWAGFGLHPRGNFEAFTQAASKQKWLECHPGRHEEWFYLEYGVTIQKRFLDHFLKGENNGWDKEPSVLLNLRRPGIESSGIRKETSWPLPNTKWTKLYLDSEASKMTWSGPEKDSSTAFKAMETSVTFTLPPFEKETEITGPLAAKVYASSSTTDMDLFVTVQAFSPDGKEVDFQGTLDPHTPLAQGWLRASHRKLDSIKSLPYRPYHSHDEREPLAPGTIYELDIEIWPTNIILPAGYALAVQVSGKDFERPVDPNQAQEAPAIRNLRGSGPFLHTLEADRPKDIFGGTTTIHTGPETPSFLLVPIIGQ